MLRIYTACMHRQVWMSYDMNRCHMTYTDKLNTIITKTNPFF